MCLWSVLVGALGMLESPCYHGQCMALLTVNKVAVLPEEGNSALKLSVFHVLARNFCLCACVPYVTRHSFVENGDRKRRVWR